LPSLLPCQLLANNKLMYRFSKSLVTLIFGVIAGISYGQTPANPNLHELYTGNIIGTKFNNDGSVFTAFDSGSIYCWQINNNLFRKQFDIEKLGQLEALDWDHDGNLLFIIDNLSEKHLYKIHLDANNAIVKVASMKATFVVQSLISTDSTFTISGETNSVTYNRKTNTTRKEPFFYRRSPSGRITFLTYQYGSRTGFTNLANNIFVSVTKPPLDQGTILHEDFLSDNEVLMAEAFGPKPRILLVSIKPSVKIIDGFEVNKNILNGGVVKYVASIDGNSWFSIETKLAKDIYLSHISYYTRELGLVRTQRLLASQVGQITKSDKYVAFVAYKPNQNQKLYLYKLGSQ
jgi:hypothetical protein